MNLQIEKMRKKLEAVGLLPLRVQTETSVKVLKERLDVVLQKTMAESDIDFWLVMATEYNEDPVMRSLFTWDMPTARRLSVLMFHKKPDGSIRRMSAWAPSPQMNKLYENCLNPGEDIWDCLVRVIQECAPKTIGINTSENFGMGDGLAATLKDKLEKALPDEYKSRLKSAENLCITYLQNIAPIEEKLMKTVVEVTQDIINMAYSNESITPGVTTTTDLEWIMREATETLQCDHSFGPDVDLQRMGCENSRLSDSVIMPGDLLHCDIGVKPRYIHLHSDIQRLAYVAKPGETQVPEGLKKVLANGNRFQDIVMENMMSEKSGNEIFTKALKQGLDEGLSPMLYTHPIGAYCHNAGPTIGMYGIQKEIPGKGDYRVTPVTCFALELNCLTKVSEWENQEIFAYLEEDIWCHEKPDYINGRQTEIIFVK